MINIRDIAQIFWPADDPEPVPRIGKNKTTIAAKERQVGRYTPIAGQLWVDDRDKNDNTNLVLSYSRAEKKNGWGNKTDKLTEQDIAELTTRGMGRALDKAAELKPLWCQGLTVAEIVRAFAGTYGYGERTVKSYVAAFNAALSGGGVESGQGAK